MFHNIRESWVSDVELIDGQARNRRLDTLRGLACLLLVLYHVIGSDEHAGLHLGYPHPLRIFADELSDLRMPLFAFVSGFVYQFRPARLAGFSRFARGKIRRIVVPGLIAIAVFALLSTAIASPFAVPPERLWTAFVFPYAHYWYFEAIFAIFILFGALDAALGNRREEIVLAVACAVYLLAFTLPTTLFSLNDTVYLAPYFIFGVAVHRRDFLVHASSRKLLLTCLAVILYCGLYKYWLYTSGVRHVPRLTWVSLVMGLSLSLSLGAYLGIRRSDALSFIGANSFVIYLYHPLGSSAARRVLEAAGFADPYMHLLPGLVAGVALPLLMAAALKQYPPAARLVLGLAPRRGARGAGPVPAPSRAA